jgi:glycyl-tRNA synthetase beta subunit
LQGTAKRFDGRGACIRQQIINLAGLFAIGEVPTGDKDPYALRRHAIGVIRLLREKSLGLSVQRLLAIGAGAFEDHADVIKKSPARHYLCFALNLPTTD